MKMDQLQKVTFAWASSVIGAAGMFELTRGNYPIGIAFILLALGIETAREYLKKQGIITEVAKKTKKK